MYKYILPIMALITISTNSSPLNAQDDEFDPSLDELLALGLEDLADIRVETASKRKESIYEAPGITDIITAKDIAQFGSNSLIDIIRRIPGIYLFGGALSTEGSASIRGQKSTAFNKHILFLIDGRPIKDGYLQGLYTQIYRTFPVSTIDHVEVIRGPGSVLYGSGAYSGVINVITKKAPEELQQKASYNYGSFNTRIGEYSASGTKDELAYTVALRDSNIGGWDYESRDANGTSSSYDAGETGHSSYINLEYNNFSFTSYEAFFTDNVLGLENIFPQDVAKRGKHYFDAGYTLPMFNNDWTAQFNLTYNGDSSDLSDDLFHGFTHSMLYEASIDGTLFEKTNLLAGVSYYDVRGSEKPNLASDITINLKDKWKTAYVQLDHQILDNVKIVAGLQYNDIGLKNPNYSPRLALIGQFSEQWGGKLMYGKAFRSPSFDETNIFLPTALFIGNPDLAPETITTYDAQLFYKSKNLYSALTLYMSSEEGIIEFSDLGEIIADVFSYRNGGTISYSGIEFETKYQFNPQWNLQGSMTYQNNESQNGITDVKLVPNLLIKTGVGYTSLNKAYTLGLYNVHYGEPRRNPTAAVQNPPSEAFNYLTANLSINIPTALDNKNIPDTTFTLFGTNLLEKDPVFFRAEFVGNPNTLPQWAGRAIYGKFSVKF